MAKSQAVKYGLIMVKITKKSVTIQVLNESYESQEYEKKKKSKILRNYFLLLCMFEKNR